MATIFGTLGAVSWGESGDWVYALTNSLLAPATFTLTATGETVDSTRFTSATGGAAWNQMTKGLRSVSGSLKFYLPSPRIGSTGLVTLSTYGSYMDSYTLNISAKSEKSTRFNSTAPEWHSYTPGPVSWTGTCEGPYDSATALPGPLLDTTTSLSFQVLSGGSGKTLSGNGYITSVGVTSDPNALTRAQFSFVGQSALATAGTASELWAADSSPPPYSLTVPETGKTLTLTTTTGHAYAGESQWTGISLKGKADALIEVSVNFQGSGAWTGFTGV